MSSNYPPFGNTPGYPCQRCGRPLPSNEAYCANCGFMNTPAQPQNTVAPSSSGMAWGGAASQNPFGAGQPAGQQWGQSPQTHSTSPANPFNNPAVPHQSFGSPQQPGQTPGSASSYQQSPTTNPFYSTPSQFGQQSPSPTTGSFQNNIQNSFAPSATGFSQPQQQGGFSSQPVNSFAPSGFGQQTQQPITGEFTPPSALNTFQGGFTQSSPFNGYQQQLNGQAQPQSPPRSPQPPARKRRPRVGLIITIIVLLVLVVGGGIGGYLYVKHSHTPPTVQVTPTMVPTPTPTGKALFSDTFANNNNGWDLTTKPGEFSVKVGGGTMVLEDDNNRLLWELVPGSKNFNDFYMTADATLSKGTQSNGYGVYIRGASNQTIDLATYYRFEIYGDGTYAIFKGSVDSTGVSTSSRLVDYVNSPVIQKQGHLNHIAINAKGSTLTFSVNGHILKIVNDNTYTTGSIAFFVSNLLNTTRGAQATFANVAIYPPQP